MSRAAKRFQRDDRSQHAVEMQATTSASGESKRTTYYKLSPDPTGFNWFFLPNVVAPPYSTTF